MPQVQAHDRRLLVEWTSDLRLLTAEEFEWFVGEVFRRKGWRVEEVGQQSGPDGNVDLRMRRDSTTVVVQCKRWSSRHVRVDEIRGFAGTLMREGLPASSGYFVTLSGFTSQGRSEGDRLGLRLVHGPELYRLAEGVRRAEPCPSCRSPMMLDRSTRGWWLRCVAEGCKGKRDLGREPGRAIELLTSMPE